MRSTAELLARETLRLIASETLDRDHLDAANVDPRDQRLHEIIARRRAELDLLRPEGPMAEVVEVFAGLHHDHDGPDGACLCCWRAKELHRLIQEGLTFTEADARVQAADGKAGMTTSTVRPGWPPFSQWQRAHAKRTDRARYRRVWGRQLTRAMLTIDLRPLQSQLRTVGEQLDRLARTSPHAPRPALDLGGDGSWIARARIKGMDLGPLQALTEDHWHVEVPRG